MRKLDTHTLWAILAEGEIVCHDLGRKLLVTWDGLHSVTLWSEETPGLYCKRVVKFSGDILDTPTGVGQELIETYLVGKGG